MNFLTLGPAKAIPWMLLFASFYQLVKKPLAVDERHIFLKLKRFTVQPSPQAPGVATVVTPFTFICLM